MANFLRTGSDWLADQHKAHASQSVTYKRGVDTVILAATIGQTLFDVESGEGQHESYEARDYLILAADLVLAAVQVEPQRGDRIDEVVGEITYTYEVMAPGTEPVFRYSDGFRKRLRIHTKLITQATL